MPSLKSGKLSLFDLCLFTFLGTGFFPRAPGTVASVVSTFLFFLLYQINQHWITLFFFTLLIFFISFWRLRKSSYKTIIDQDPGWIVIDEFLGIGLGLSLLAIFFHLSVNEFVGNLIFFRFFDILKIFPANIMNNKSGAFPLIADDLISGLQSFLCTFGLFYLGGLL